MGSICENRTQCKILKERERHIHKERERERERERKRERERERDKGRKREGGDSLPQTDRETNWKRLKLKEIYHTEAVLQVLM